MIKENKKDLLLFKSGYPIHNEYETVPEDMELVFMNGIFRHGSRFWSSYRDLKFYDLLKKDILKSSDDRKNAILLNKYRKLIKNNGEDQVENICNKGIYEIKEIGKSLYNAHPNYFKKIKKINYETTSKIRTIQTKKQLVKSLSNVTRRKIPTIKISTKNNNYKIDGILNYRSLLHSNSSKEYNIFKKNNFLFLKKCDKFINIQMIKDVRNKFGIREDIGNKIVRDMLEGLFESLNLTGTFKYTINNDTINLSCFPSKYNNLQESIYLIFLQTGLSYSFNIIELCKLVLLKSIINKIFVKLSNIILHQIGEDLDKAMLNHNKNINSKTIVDPIFYFGHAGVLMPVITHLIFMGKDIDKESKIISKKFKTYVSKMEDVSVLEPGLARLKLMKMYFKLLNYSNNLVTKGYNFDWITPMSGNILFRLMKSKIDKEYYVQILLNGRTFSPPSFKQQKMIKLREFRDMLLKNYLTSKEFKKLSGE